MRKPLLSAMALAVALTLTACAPEVPKQTVTDPQGRFAVSVPESWQTRPEQDVTVLFAADKLPTSEEEALDTLTIGIYSASGEDTATPEARLTALLERRAEDQSWQKTDFSEPQSVDIAGKQGTAIEFSTFSAGGRAFSGRAVLIRDGDKQYLVFASAPGESWETDAQQLDDVLASWDWSPKKPSTESK